MTCAKKMCEDCPFRLRLTKAERVELAAIPAAEFPCHTEDGYVPGSSGIECRGHWEVRRKFSGVQWSYANFGSLLLLALILAGYL